ncbi:unnamed protein product [Linum tenue]|uniref:F-box domain-containing protein n=1 Tax=Linum tenue TaxID=586396 RepID=A0AAV0R537_9ROSI|nr:unnamed protein product [Linum tenue]
MARVRETRADRITNLPVDVLNRVLVLLPIKDAAKTSILSTKWRHQWRSIPELVFDGSFPVGPGGSPSTSMMNKTMFNIFKALLLHDGPIKKFVIAFPGLRSCYGNAIDEIVLYLSQRHLEEFALPCAAGDGQKYKLHSSLFTCLQLNMLRLRHCELGQPSWFVGFGKLMSLVLMSVTLPSDFCENFLLKCPMLKRLRVTDCDGPSNLEIVAPRLVWFRFSYRDPQKICFKCTPLLVSLRLCWNFEKTADMVALLASLPALKEFNVDFGLPQNIAVGVSDVPSRLPAPLHRLKRLHTWDLDFRSLETARFFVCLIISSPNLRELTIKLRRSKPSQPAANRDATTTSIGSLLEAEYRHGSGDCFLQKLRVFRIEKCLGTQVELDLVKFVLATAPVLERIHIPPLRKLSSGKIVEFMKEIMKYKRLSKEAMVIYKSK